MYKCPEWDYIKQNYEWNETFMLYQHYDSDTFYNMNLEKNIDILLYGDIQYSAYPLRKKIYQILQSMKEYNVKLIDRDGDFTANINSVSAHRKDLSNLINRSHICIATCSKYEYFLCKYLEIVASNSVVAGNMESIGRTMFENNFIELDLNMSKNEIKQKLIDALKNKRYLKIMNEKVYANICKNNLSIQKNYWDNLNVNISKLYVNYYNPLIKDIRGYWET